MENRLEIAHRLSQRLTQQQLRFVKLLELSAPELDEAVEHELEANPALTTEDAAASAADTPREGAGRDSNSPSYFNFGSRALNADPDAPAFTPRDNSESLTDILTRQIDEREVDPEVAETARYIVGNLDNNGWLTRSIPQMLNDLAIFQDRHVDTATAEKALELVRSLDPPGVGADNLADTLLLQLQRMSDSTARNDAIDIISRFFREYHMRHSHKIISGLGLSRQRLDAANQLILSLNPKPGALYGGAESTAAATIIPDFVISNDDDELTIQLTSRLPELTVESTFSEAVREMEQRKRDDRKGAEFIMSSFNDARDFIKIIRQRRQTLMSVMTAIVDFQKDYFETGDVYTLRPMMLKDIVALTGLDISTISRATANKYVALPWGEILPLKAFFSGRVNMTNFSGNSAKATIQQTDERTEEHGVLKPENASATESVTTDHEALTNRQIQAAIAELIVDEDPRRPLSDEKIRNALEKQGYEISRRTVAKYRDRAGIPIARLRRKF
ncbi:MAG: hypothetical protein K2M56_06645 [Muribaculaceae bacterium]|nr:hypothetical protein [Muribaculaceae bacterium]